MVYFNVMERLGKQKRDILVQRIVSARKDQQATQEQLKTTLQVFQEVTGFSRRESRKGLRQAEQRI
jgi:hypothetical protein